MLPSEKPNAGLGQRLDLDTALHLDLAVDDELRSADIDVVARPGAPGLHHQARLVIAEIDGEAGLGERRVVVGVALADRPPELALLRLGDAQRGRGEELVRGIGRDAALDRVLGIDVEAELHQGLGLDHRGRVALQHGDLGPALPEVDGDVVAGAGGAEHGRLGAAVVAAVVVLARMDDPAPEAVGARQLDPAGRAVGAGGKDQLPWAPA